jgi:hypothetical protein
MAKRQVNHKTFRITVWVKKMCIMVIALSLKITSANESSDNYRCTRHYVLYSTVYAQVLYCKVKFRDVFEGV